MSNKQIPILKEIKEYHISKLIDCIDCIDKNAFNRDRQRDCILKIYPNKKEKDIEHRAKSIFRGMVLPSLRYLGFIIGQGDFIRVSANGKLIIESQRINHELHQRVLSAVIYEIAENKFHFIENIRNFSSLTVKEFFNLMNDKINAFSERSKKDILRKWLAIFKQVNLIESSSKRVLLNEEEKMNINEEKLQQVLIDIDVRSKNIDDFKKYFFDFYFELAKNSAGVVDIADLREKVSLKMIEEYMILTEDQFDIMLRKIPFETDEYIISLGKPMHARDKLFRYRDSFYRTIFLKIKKG